MQHYKISRGESDTATRFLNYKTLLHVYDKYICVRLDIIIILYIEYNSDHISPPCFMRVFIWFYFRKLVAAVWCFTIIVSSLVHDSNWICRILSEKSVRVQDLLHRSAIISDSKILINYRF